MPGFNLGYAFTSGSCTQQTITVPDGRGGTKQVTVGTAGLIGNSSDLGNTRETARQHRFKLSVTELPGVTDFSKIVMVACEKIDRPVMRIQSETIWNGADYARVPLRGEYDPVNATLYELLRDSGSSSQIFSDRNMTLEALLQWWTNASFSFKHSRSGFTQARQVDVLIEQLNGTGGTIWAYRLLRCWPQILNPDSLDYKNSDISKVQVTLNFDKVIELTDF